LIWGRTLGGTSAINGGFWTRPHLKEFDREWGAGWSGEDVLPFFKKAEAWEEYGPRSDLQGFDGPVDLKHATPGALDKLWMEAAASAGFDPLPNGSLGVGSQGGFWEPSSTFDGNGRRKDSFSAYLAPVLAREGLHVRTNSRVVNLELDEKEEGDVRARGVTYIAHGQIRVTAYAEREIVLCGGWSGSPKVLLASGVGPKSELEVAAHAHHRLGITLLTSYILHQLCYENNKNIYKYKCENDQIRISKIRGTIPQMLRMIIIATKMSTVRVQLGQTDTIGCSNEAWRENLIQTCNWQ
jgi:choline dehydrogenase-like flavoprotein